MTEPVFQFEEFELDCGRFQLLRKGRPLRVEPKPMELLILLVSRKGHLVSRREIVEKLWDRDVFVDTDQSINTAIRKLRHLLRDDSETPTYIETVTGMGYRFVAPITSLSGQTESHPPEEPPPGDFVAPALPSPATNGIPAPAEAAQPLQHPAPRAAWFVVPLVLILAAGVFYGAQWLIRRYQGPSLNIRSLAVLPLDNLSGDPGQDYFADGLTDELTTMLARDSTLRIVSRTSVMQYKKAHRPLREIASALGVDGIVEGSVERSAGRVHMTLQLIQANTDSHLWANSYDSDADDVALPDEAAQAIAARLHSAASTAAPVRYVNPAAHDAYLQGRYLWFSEGRLGESGKYFQKAIEIQPDYAMGWAWLSAYYGAATVAGILDPRTSLGPAEEAANRAMQLDPNLAEAHEDIAGVLWLRRWDFAGADREILRAISLDPHEANHYFVRAKILVVMNRLEDAIQVEKKGMEVDPFEHPWGLMYFYACARRYDDAIQDGQLRLKDYPKDIVVLSVMSYAYRCKGMYRESADFSARFHEAIGDPQSAVNLRRAYEQGGERGLVRWQLAQAEARAKNAYVSPVYLASLHALLRDRDQTLALLNEGCNQHAPDILYIQTDPAYDFLHSDPRYRALIRKIGMPPAW